MNNLIESLNEINGIKYSAQRDIKTNYFYLICNTSEEGLAVLAFLKSWLNLNLTITENSDRTYGFQLEEGTGRSFSFKSIDLRGSKFLPAAKSWMSLISFMTPVGGTFIHHDSHYLQVSKLNFNINETVKA